LVAGLLDADATAAAEEPGPELEAVAAQVAGAVTVVVM